MKRRTYLFLAVFAICCSFGYAITALEVFNEGRRSFDLGRWQESKETFARFMATWPEHKLNPEALYYFSLAAARTLPERSREYSDSLVDEIASAISTLSVELPGKDLTELKVAVKLAGNRNTPVTWSELANLTPAELKHYLNRNWHPDPSAAPIEALFWETTWRKKNTSMLEPDLTAVIALLKARALWQIMLSPLSMSANSDILKTWGYWPVHTCFEKEVNQGFQHGNPDIKRELALLGYHYDCFRNGGFAKADVSPRKSRWYTYLSERGLNLQEAWCPR